MLDRFPYEIFSWIIKSKNEFFPIPTLFGLVDDLTRPPIIETHVCRSWRQALLSDPTMWTYINIQNKDKGRTKELIRRSGDSSLDVIVRSFPYGLDVHAIYAVLQETHRFRILDIDIYVDNKMLKQLVHRMLSSLERPAPKLRSLSISVGGMNWVVDEEFPRIKWFSGDTPNLKHIRLRVSSGFDELLSPSILRNLLKIDLIMDTTTIDGDHFFDVLELSPQLQLLKITGWGLDDQMITSPTHSGRRIRLPRLENLSFGIMDSFDLKTAGLVLRHLEFPIENIEFQIKCDEFHIAQSEPEAATLLNVVTQQRYAHLTTFPFEDIYLEVTFDNPYPNRSTFSTQYDTFHEPKENFPDFLRTFPLTDITSLDLKNTILESTLFRNIFASLGNLMRLRIDHESPAAGDPAQESFLMALMPHITYNPPRIELLDNEASFLDGDANHLTTSGPGRSQPEFTNLPCPLLRTLRINMLDEDVELTEVYFQTVATCAEFRRQGGSPFESITIRCSRSVLREEVVAGMQRHKGFPIIVLTDQEEGGSDLDDTESSISH